MDDHKVTVFRFRRIESGREISPRHMWGTEEAIATLPGCEVLPETARRVHRKLLDPSGFYFEHAPSQFQKIDDVGRQTE